MMTIKEKAKKYFSDGMKCYENKNFEGAKAYFTKAIEGYSKVIESGTNDEFIYGSRGFAYMFIKEYPKAIEDYTKAIELGATDKYFYRSRGTAYVYTKEYPKVIEDFTKAIELGATDKDIYRNRGFAYALMENYPKAIDDFSKIIELDANDKSGYAGRGVAYLGINDCTKAIEDLTKAIELGITDKLLYRLRGIAYMGIKDCSKAINNFKEVIKLNKNDNKKNQNTGDSDYALKEIKLPDNILNLIDDILKKNESKVLPDDETLNLIELVYYCYDLMDEIKIEPSKLEEKIVHYTKAGTLQHLLKKDHSAKLRLNNAVYMNDPEEGQILKKVLCQLDKNNELENLFKDGDVKNYTYLTCFSLHNERNELPMWVHYGDGGNGVGLVFNHSFFDKTDLYKVQYMDVNNPDIKKLNENVQEKITAILNLLQEDGIKNNTRTEFKVYVNIILNYVSYLFKDKAYEYENEVRILNYRDYAGSDISTAVYESGIPRLFIEYDEYITDKNCVEVIVGPKAQYTEIAAYAKYVGIPTVSQSEIKYR